MLYQIVKLSSTKSKGNTRTRRQGYTITDSATTQITSRKTQLDSQGIILPFTHILTIVTGGLIPGGWTIRLSKLEVVKRLFKRQKITRKLQGNQKEENVLI
ncbi:hypothetical protein SAMN02745171_00076 [Porphyromonas circumdentaria]|uniref:Uncharacterized protein n=1 Tax=Porphyromonas circumdentaria TaxID=29524 RepID=A0A1T4KJR7_9PORP|nr:hypothetical protein [Porphyromonas circumdentaria]SJZ42638.1 hypothetical protein SAMN02745171_00076 [Porphyromonas circumdentaria]